jgi:hypothetical protein
MPLSFSGTTQETPKPITLAMVEAATCLWEAYLEFYVFKAGVSPMMNSDSFEAYRKAAGTATLRRNMCDPVILDACCEGNNLSRSNGTAFDLPYDWVFCPWFIEHCVMVFENSGPALVENWRDKCQALNSDSPELKKFR